MKTDNPCQPKWISSTLVECNQQMPPGWFTAAIQPNPFNYVKLCRTLLQDHVGYFDDQRGCVYVAGGQVYVNASFDLLTGSGMSWDVHYDGTSQQTNAFKIGQDSNGDLYAGRCNIHNSSFVGKVLGNKFYYNYNEKDVSDCEQYDIILC